MSSNLLFSRGYLVSNRPHKAVEGFTCKVFAGRYLSYSSLLDMHLKESDAAKVLILGTILDVRDEHSTAERCLEVLYEFIKKGKSFYDQLDYMAGRYVIFYIDGEELKVLNDATGLKCIFYYKGGGVCASHAKLVVGATGINLRSECSKYEKNVLSSNGRRFKYGYPGFETPFEGVNLLPPNNELKLSTGEIERYFPRNKNPHNQFDRSETISLIRSYMTNQIKSLLSSKAGGGDIYCSLTAGLDSRFTLSVVRDFNQIRFFTYCYPNNKVHEADVSTARLIGKILGLNHCTLRVNPNIVDSREYKEFTRNLEVNTIYSPHSRSIAFKYFQEFGDNNILIRSNLYEIGRAFWQSKGYDCSEQQKDANFLAGYFLSIYDKEAAISMPANKAFLEYLKKTSFCERLHDYDPLDLFYWEHRMGVWHAQVCVESDPAFETLVLCNARVILNAFLSVSLEERKLGVIFDDSITEAVPEIKEIPINKKSRDEYDDFHVKLFRKDNRLVGEIITSESNIDDKYAFYLFRGKDRVSISRYTSSPVVSFEDCLVAGDYYVRGFIKRNGTSAIAKSSRPLRLSGDSKDIDLLWLKNEALKDGLLRVQVKNWTFDLKVKVGSRNGLIVFLNGAIGDRSKIHLPIFQRSSWATDFEDSVLNISDPTLNLDSSLRIGWYFGSNVNPLIEELSSLIFAFADALQVSRSDVILYGSSAGGFAALALGAFMQSGVGAVAINPQTNILNYHPSLVKNFLRACCEFGAEFLNENPEYGELKKQLTVIDVWKSNPNARGLIYQNKLDTFHYYNHYKPFINALGISEDTFSEKHAFKTMLFSDPKGHVAENRKMAVTLISMLKCISVKAG